MKASQDIDLRLRLLLNGVKQIYAKGGNAYYRRCSQDTVSNQITESHMRSRLDVLKKAEAIMLAKGVLQEYRVPLARRYYSLGVSCLVYGYDLERESLACAFHLAGRRAISTDGSSWINRLLCYTIGIKHKEHLAKWLDKHGIRQSERKVNNERLALLQGKSKKSQELGVYITTQEERKL